MFKETYGSIPERYLDKIDIITTPLIIDIYLDGTMINNQIFILWKWPGKPTVKPTCDYNTSAKLSLELSDANDDMMSLIGGANPAFRQEVLSFLTGEFYHGNGQIYILSYTLFVKWFKNSEAQISLEIRT